MNVQARKDREAHIAADAHVAELEAIIKGIAVLASDTATWTAADVINLLADRLDIAKAAAERAARMASDNPVTCMFTIQKGTPAWDELMSATGSPRGGDEVRTVRAAAPALDRIQFDPRENGVAIKVDRGVWSPTLVAYRQPARRP